MRKIIITISAVLIMWNCPVKAQFNTVSNTSFHYNVETANEVSMAEYSDTEKRVSAPDDISLTDTDPKTRDQTARNLCICYPLSKIKVNSPYGYRKDPITGIRRFHNGLDLHARNAKVYAMMIGEVVKVGQDKASGKYVTLKHGNFTVSYCHLSRILACQGQTVRAGDIVGITGSTGRSTGEHLHITCKFKGKPIDPMLIFNKIKVMRQEYVA